LLTDPDEVRVKLSKILNRDVKEWEFVHDCLNELCDKTERLQEEKAKLERNLSGFANIIHLYESEFKKYKDKVSKALRIAEFGSESCGYYYCPCCENNSIDGHKDGCLIKECIDETEGLDDRK
jgi:hypothetical protein